jgi:hypothetical protein
MDVSFKVPVILSKWKKERKKGGRKEGNNEVNMTINPITLPSKTTVYLEVYTFRLAACKN